MGILDSSDFSLLKQKPIKLEKVKLPKLYATKMGDRTLTSAQKREAKERANYRCEKCKKGFKKQPKYLHVHHKKSVASHKDKLGFDVPVYSWDKKLKPKYDRKSNLQVLCLDCHDKTKKHKKKKQKAIWEM